MWNLGMTSPIALTLKYWVGYTILAFLCKNVVLILIDIFVCWYLLHLVSSE